MTTKEVAQICGVSIPTVTGNAKKVGIIFENGKAYEWTEEELKKVQVQLMKNTTARGNATTSGRVVEETVETVSDIDGFKYYKEDICNMCNVSSTTFDRFVALSSMTNRDFLSIGSSHKKLYNKKYLKVLQI